MSSNNVRTLVDEAPEVSAPAPLYAPHEVIARLSPFVILDRIVVAGAPPSIKIALNEETKTIYVAKRIIKWKLTQRGHENYCRGLEIHKRLNSLNHEGIVDLVATFEDNEAFYLIMEKLDADLITLVERRRRVPEPEARAVFKKVVNIVSFIHKNNVSHRDLKPDNFLINFCKTGQCVVNVKLTDFELAADLSDKKEFSIFCGSHAYAAPEICMKEEYDGTKVDVWSLGVMLYTMLCGEFPWNHYDAAKLFDMIIYDPFDVPEHLSPDASSILHGLLAKQPKERISINELLEHPWLNDIPVSICELSGHSQKGPTVPRKISQSSYSVSADTSSESF